MNWDYSGKTVVVTGSSGALGMAVVRAYVGAGAFVVTGDRQAPSTAHVEGNVAFHQLDVLDEDKVESFFAEVKERHGGLDVLVNVIGGYKAGEPVQSLPLADFESQFDINLKSAFLLTKHAVSAMLEKGGSIVHISSRAAVDSGKNSFAYSASKQAVLRLVEAVAEENHTSDVRINAVMPSIIDTPANRQSMPKADHANWPKPEQVASVLLFLTSPDAELISGAAIPVYGKA